MKIKKKVKPSGAGAWTRRAARLNLIRQSRVSIQPLREIAQKLTQKAAKDNGKVVVNIGGTAAKGEPAAAINLNPNLEGMGRKNIPNLVETYGEYIGSLFKSNQVDEIVSQGLSPGAFDWARVVSGSGKVLKSGGNIRIQFRWADEVVAQ